MTVELSCSSPIGDDAVTPLMMVSIGITIGDIILLRPQSKHRSNVCMHHLLNCLIEQLRDGLKILMCCCHVTSLSSIGLFLCRCARTYHVPGIKAVSQCIAQDIEAEHD